MAVYDYGMGGIWPKIAARSPEEIVERYPQLTVFEAGQRPNWMTEAQEGEFVGSMHFDLDAHEDPWLASLRGLD